MSKPSLKTRLDDLLKEYGPVAIVIYLVLFVLTVAGFATAIRMGVRMEGAPAGASTLLAAWLLAKATQPVRILATLALTPLVARVVRKFRRPPPPAT